MILNRSSFLQVLLLSLFSLTRSDENYFIIPKQAGELFDHDYKLECIKDIGSQILARKGNTGVCGINFLDDAGTEGIKNRLLIDNQSTEYGKEFWHLGSICTLTRHTTVDLDSCLDARITNGTANIEPWGKNAEALVYGLIAFGGLLVLACLIGTSIACINRKKKKSDWNLNLLPSSARSDKNDGCKCRITCCSK